MLHKMGAPQFATRLDIDPNQQSNNTPGKTIFHNVSFLNYFDNILSSRSFVLILFNYML